MSDVEQRTKVLVTVNFSDDLLDRIRKVSDRLEIVHHSDSVPEAAWREAEILFTARHYPSLEQAPNLRWIQLISAGFNRALREPIIQSNKITVTSASGIHARQIANYCLMMMLAFNYKLPKMFFFQRRSEWPKNRDQFNPIDMHRQTLGIVGYGSIARELARLAAQLGMTVLATKRDVMRPAETSDDYTPEGTGDPDGTIPDRLYPSHALATMAADCDYLVVTTPLTEETRHMVNEAIFKVMKPSAILINIARGSVVDEAALVAALKADEIGGAALDVFEEEPLPTLSPLWEMDQVIISPHVSGASDSYNDLVTDLFVANLRRYLEGKPLMNKLDRDAGY